MNEWLKQVLTIALTAVVTGALFFMWKGLRSNVIEEIEKDQKERHEQNIEKFSELKESVNGLTTVVATQTTKITALRDTQNAHDRNQHEALEALRISHHELAERVHSIEQYIRDQKT